MNSNDLDSMSIEQLIEYINSELLKGRTMKDIEISDFEVNERVITKRLSRKGYKRVDNIFVKGLKNNGNNEYNKSITPVNMSNRHNNDGLILHGHDKKVAEIMISKHGENLIELAELTDQIKDMLEKYNREKDIIEVEAIELKPRPIGEVKQKLFKIDVDVIKDWDEFVLNHKEFKVQQLISEAIKEFIEKYK